MPYIKHKSGKTYYRVYGKKTAPGLPIVCLHGGPGGTHFGLRRLAELKNDRKIVLYDQIGSGRSSELPQRLQSIATLVEDLVRLLKALKITRFHLLGGSWGGSLALEYYFRTGGAGVESMILQSPLVSSTLWQQDAEKLIRTLSAEQQKVIRCCLEAGATDSKVYTEAEKAYYKRYVYRGKPRKERERYFARYPNRHGAALYKHMWGASEFTATGTLKNYERFKDLARIKVPVLFIGGQYDEATPARILAFRKKVPGAKSVIIKGASHSILSERPGAMIRQVRRFVRSVEL